MMIFVVLEHNTDIYCLITFLPTNLLLSKEVNFDVLPLVEIDHVT